MDTGDDRARLRRDPNGGSRPVPDPTTLTTQALEREVSNLKEMVIRELEGLKSTITTRFAGMDEATTLLREHQEKVPSETDKAILHLRELMDARNNQISTVMDEKFKGVEKQFIERDTRTEQTSRDSKVAVDAALQAAKEAVGEQNKSSAAAISKSEASTTKQMDQIGTLIATTTKSSDEKIDDLKQRLGLIEGRSSGGDRSELRHGQSNRDYVAMLAVGVAALAFMYSFLRTPTAPQVVIGPPEASRPAEAPPVSTRQVQ